MAGFEQALVAMKQGGMAQRDSWMNKDMAFCLKHWDKPSVAYFAAISKSTGEPLAPVNLSDREIMAEDWTIVTN